MRKVHVLCQGSDVDFLYAKQAGYHNEPVTDFDLSFITSEQSAKLLLRTRHNMEYCTDTSKFWKLTEIYREDTPEAELCPI